MTMTPAPELQDMLAPGQEDMIEDAALTLSRERRERAAKAA